MAITVYTVSGAPRPWRLLLGLTFKGLPPTLKLLQASKQEHKQEPFLSLNPRGTVPVLVDGATVIRDSLAALAWLDRAYPDRPLFGVTTDDAANIWQIAMEAADYLRKANHGLLAPIFFRDAQLPTPELIEAAQTISREFGWLGSVLGDQSFLAGETPSAADAVAYPEVRLVIRAMDTKPDIMGALGLMDRQAVLGGLAAWVERIEALPGVDKTFPPHWQDK